MNSYDGVLSHLDCKIISKLLEIKPAVEMPRAHRMAETSRCLIIGVHNLARPTCN